MWKSSSPIFLTYRKRYNYTGVLSCNTNPNANTNPNPNRNLNLTLTQNVGLTANEYNIGNI